MEMLLLLIPGITPTLQQQKILIGKNSYIFQSFNWRKSQESPFIILLIQTVIGISKQ